jgi:3',5'-cyclic AMP phosphodiesterase CpdA
MRIAHVSDLHLLSLEGARLAHFLNKRWTGGINLALSRGRHYQAHVFAALVDDLNRQGVDHVVCTGDVTNLSFESEFAFARSHFQRIARPASEVTCIPGNHDTYVAEMEGAFERVFGDHCQSDDAWRATDGARWPMVRVRGEVAFIGLTTSRATAWFMAHGTVGADQLRRLDELLASPALARKLKVILLHHPPAGARAKKITRGLRDHAALADVIARRGAGLVLHGHEHLDVRETLPGPGGEGVPVRGITAGSYELDHEHRRARYRIYTVEQGEVVGEELRGLKGGVFAAET